MISRAGAETEPAVRRRLAQLRRAVLCAHQLGPHTPAEMTALLTAARRLAFLYLLEQSQVTSRHSESLEAELGNSLRGRRDRFYFETLIPRCAELLGEEIISPAPIPDEQFGAWLDLFRSWRWDLSEDAGPEYATPGLLGAICEFALDQKTHGAYFTSPDVTAYICESVLLPALFDGQAVFNPDSGVDRYTRPANREPGLLPLETEYERAVRQERLDRCRRAWEAGEIRTPDDWITWNLNLPLRARDWIRGVADLAAVARFYSALEALRVLDPTCGSGAFLMAALETLLPLHLACRERLASPPATEAEVVAGIVRRNLYGIDQAPEAVETCRMRLLLRIAAAGGSGPVGDHVRCGDVLLDDLFPEVRKTGGFDAVVGNPPYVACAPGSRHGEAGYATASCGNLYALVTERAARLLQPAGRLGMILPVSSTSLPGFRPLAELLRRGKAWISSYSNRPGKLFPGVEQRLSIWITGPSDSPATYASAYQHWYAEERGHLFSRLSYAPASTWAGTGMPIKGGSPEAESLFSRIAAHVGYLGELEVRQPVGGERGGTVWLHDGPTYWVRALAFEPNPETPQEAGHYHRIRVADPQSALILSGILSSTAFYFFFKMVSNCRDLGRKEWAALPLNPLAPAQVRELEALSRELQDRLRETARLRSRRYPSGVVAYREYYPGKAKPTLDAIDRVLARHYGLSAAELECLLNYDLKYRMGQNDAG